jgi:hypothetical protein
MRSRCSGRYESGGGAGRQRRSAGEEDGRAGPACQRGRKGEGRVGRRGGEGRWAAAGSKTGNGPKLKKNLFEFQLILEIWQKFGKLHKEI